jgi:uncharacterized phiE125 gp8 family phage protein
MALYLVTAPTVQPLSLSEAKLHLKVETTAEDALIEGLIRAATDHCETFTGRALCRQTWDDKRESFPAGTIWLAKPPVVSVTSVTYLDGNGDSQVWATDQYGADLPAGPQAQRGRIYPAHAINYPTTRDIPNAVTIRAVHGYAGAAQAVTSITRSSTTATVTTTAAHGYSTGQRVTIAGSDQADYNGTVEITVTGAAMFTFTVANSPTTPATGTMTAAILGIPDPVVAAMKLLIAHWYEQRAAVVVGTGAVPAPMAVDALLWPFKVF